MKPLTPEMQAVPPLMMKARRKTEAACEAIQEAIAALIVMAGTAHGQGRRFGLGRSAAHRHHDFTGPVALRSEAAPRSGLPD